LKKLAFLLSLIALCFSAQAAILNGGFELGPTSGPPTDWTDTDTAFGSSRCAIADCGNAGGLQGPHTGTYWIWFGGTPVAQTSVLSQSSVLIPVNTAVEFYFQITHIGGPASLTFSVDSTALWSVSNADQATYPTYSLVNVPLGIFADGGLHTLRFDFVHTAGGSTTNYGLDDISLVSATSPVPEPSTAALLALGGLAGLALRRFRRA